MKSSTGDARISAITTAASAMPAARTAFGWYRIAP